MSGPSKEEATWEDYIDTTLCFPDLTLEDKGNLEGEKIVETPLRHNAKLKKAHNKTGPDQRGGVLVPRDESPSNVG